MLTCGGELIQLYEETQMKQIVLNIKARILKCFEVLKDSSHFIGYKGGTSWGVLQLSWLLRMLS